MKKRTKTIPKSDGSKPRRLADKERWDAIHKIEDDYARNEKLTINQRFAIMNGMYEYVQRFRKNKSFDWLNLTEGADNKKRIAQVLSNV